MCVMVSSCTKNLQLDSAVEGDPRSRRTGSWLGVEGRWRGGRLGVGRTLGVFNYKFVVV